MQNKTRRLVFFGRLLPDARVIVIPETVYPVVIYLDRFSSIFVMDERYRRDLAIGYKWLGQSKCI